MEADRKIGRFEEIDQYVGMIIRRVRLMQNVSRKQMAGLLEVSETQLSKYENGSNRISPGRLQVLAQYLDTPIQEFFPLKLESLSDERQFSELKYAFNSLPNDYMKKQVLEIVQCMAYGARQMKCDEQQMTIAS